MRHRGLVRIAGCPCRTVLRGAEAGVGLLSKRGRRRRCGDPRSPYLVHRFLRIGSPDPDRRHPLRPPQPVRRSCHDAGRTPMSAATSPRRPHGSPPRASRRAPEEDPVEAAAEAGLLAITAAAQRAGVSRYTVAGWISSGQLPVVRIAGRRYVRPADLAETQVRARVGDVVPAWRRNRRRAGKRLRAIREAAGWNQQKLGAASGLTHENISRLETGEHAPQAATVIALAHALQVAPEQFVRREQTGLTLLTVAEVANRLEVPAGR